MSGRMGHVRRWFVHRPRAYAALALALFPYLVAEEIVASFKRDFLDFFRDTKSEIRQCWSALIDAYKEWPENIYEVCKREQARYEKEEATNE